MSRSHFKQKLEKKRGSPKSFNFNRDVNTTLEVPLNSQTVERPVRNVGIQPKVLKSDKHDKLKEDPSVTEEYRRRFSQSHRIVMCGDHNGSISIYDCDTMKVLRHHMNVHHYKEENSRIGGIFQFSNELVGSLTSGDTRGKPSHFLKLYSLEHGKVVDSFKVGEGYFSSLSHTISESCFLYSSKERGIVIYDIIEKKEIAQIPEFTEFGSLGYVYEKGKSAMQINKSGIVLFDHVKCCVIDKLCPDLGLGEAKYQDNIFYSFQGAKNSITIIDPRKKDKVISDTPYPHPHQLGVGNYIQTIEPCKMNKSKFIISDHENSPNLVSYRKSRHVSNVLLYDLKKLTEPVYSKPAMFSVEKLTSVDEGQYAFFNRCFPHNLEILRGAEFSEDGEGLHNVGFNSCCGYNFILKVLYVNKMK